MAIVKLILALVMLAVTMSLTTRIFFTYGEEKQNATVLTQPKKKVSRFLVQQAKPIRNPNAADHCSKNEEICRLQGGENSTMACCSNKCSDLNNDDGNCGACKNQCMFTQACCRGECVYLTYDKRHCGECNHRCQDNESCVYGMCSYA